jgi:CheY-like chemotaxis protein
MIELLNAVAALAWPLLAAAVFGLLYPTLRGVIQSRGFTVKVGSMEVTVQQVSDQLRTQVDDLQKRVLELQERIGASAADAPTATATATESSTARRVLWVDDNPHNNALEIASLRDNGVDVVQARSTAEALALARDTRHPYSVIVSDMGRKEDTGFRSDAGLQLLSQLRNAGDNTPFVIYASDRAVRTHARNASAMGALGITASPSELKRLLQQAGIG